MLRNYDDTGIITYKHEALKRLLNPAEVLKTAVKKVSPVDTGAMRDSFDIEVIGEDSMVVGTDKDYAFWVECGTRKMLPRLFFSNALINNLSPMSNALGG